MTLNTSEYPDMNTVNITELQTVVVKVKGEQRYGYTCSLTSALMGVHGQHHAPAALPPGKRPGTHCTGGWVGPGTVWTGAVNLAPNGARTPKRPARNESLHRLSYFGRYRLVVNYAQWSKCITVDKKSRILRKTDVTATSKWRI